MTRNAYTAVSGVLAAGLLAAASAMTPGDIATAPPAAPSGSTTATPTTKALRMADIAERTWVLTGMTDIANRPMTWNGQPPIRLRIEADSTLAVDSATPLLARVMIEDFAGDQTLLARELGSISAAACVAPTPTDNRISNACIAATTLNEIIGSRPRLYLVGDELTLAADDTTASFRPKG